MTDFTRQPDEEPAAWLERLLLTRSGDLSNEQRRDLAPYIQAAERAAGVIVLFRSPGPRPPEGAADDLIDVYQAEAGGPYFLHLKGAERILLGPYENADSAYNDFGKVRLFLAEVIRKARREGAASAPS